MSGGFLKTRLTKNNPPKHNTLNCVQIFILERILYDDVMVEIIVKNIRLYCKTVRIATKIGILNNLQIIIVH